ncbi:hypothetical protein AXG93_3719s1160 [Marchantia polymorpha subsp. ruderalis]|uniref:Uncharacterized protein n=1 Tax=Marchantia polymorpha subsp. ruderalis TaxID=1480154 RepID=A0A176VN45_MARPO|nr:hypothetical protein AXG93_3719s1160 [Marchantia polymorpha subsp. ruderalis]
MLVQCGNLLLIGIVITSIGSDDVVNKAMCKFANLEGSPEDDIIVLVFLRGGVVKPRLCCSMKRARFSQALIWL